MYGRLRFWIKYTKILKLKYNRCSKIKKFFSSKFFKIVKFWYTYYILTLKFLYILFKISWKFSNMCFLNFVECLLFLWNFLKFLPQFIQNSSSFPKYFLKIFTLKICLNIAWNCYKCTKNVLRISYKFIVKSHLTFYDMFPPLSSNSLIYDVNQHFFKIKEKL